MRLAITLGFAGLLFLTPDVASAQQHAPTTPKATAIQKAAARTRYAKGVELWDRAEVKHDPALYEAAYAEFAQAYSLYTDYRVLWNLALSEIETKRYIEALAHLREYERRGPDDRPHEMHELMARASAATGHLAIEAPAGSRISVDGADVGSAPLADPIDTTAGAHRVVSRAKDGEHVASPVAVLGQVTPVRFDEPAPPLPPVVVAPLVVPPPPAPIQTNAAEVALPAPHDEPSAPRERHPSIAKVVTVSSIGATGVVLFVVGALDLMAASDAEDQRAALAAANPSCRAPSPGCASLADAADRRASDHNAGIALAASGGALVAGAVVTWFLWPNASSSMRAWVPTPVVSPSSASLGWSGSF